VSPNQLHPEPGNFQMMAMVQVSLHSCHGCITNRREVSRGLRADLNIALA
jgi:hypothetical protein